MTTVDVGAAVAEAVAQDINDAGIAVLLPDGSAYSAGTVAITFGDVPPSPDQIVALTWSLAGVDSLGDDATVLLQARYRGSTDFRSVTARSSAVVALLAGRRDTVIGGVPVAVVIHVHGQPMGQDEHDRWEWEDTFHILVNWATPWRTE